MVSCVTLQRPNLGKQKIELTKNNLDQLNGDYDLKSKDNSNYRLPFVLIYYHCCGYDTIIDQGDRVSLQVLTNNRIRITIVDDNEIVRTKILKGEIKDGYFEYNSIHLSSFWVLLNAYTRKKMRIGLLPDGSLVVDVARVSWGLLVLMPITGYSEKASDIEFSKKDGISQH
ncbi:MAG: hypothetical protein HOP30_09310 [Cyclobacteriaceae bacterium]|nr:hypothetical protein [Cyclobacteriaceae bacterium]